MKSEALRIALNEPASGKLFLVEEILEGYEELLVLESYDCQAGLDISLRTFRYWVKEGLFSVPLRKRFNQALYPAGIIRDLLAIRIFQNEFDLSWLKSRTCLY